jgi:3-dehydroquinate synthase
METLKVDLGNRSYDIMISSNWLDDLGKTVKPLIPDEKVLLITDEKVGSLYADKALASLQNADINAEVLTLPEGEENKNIKTVEKIYNFLAEYNYTRKSSLVALGGGVIGDITGFAAATYMRGINYIQVPTSLLAMVDSSVGGKTGVNHPLGKNLIGAFYQPQIVFIDTSLLETLAPEEFQAGLGEVIKYGVIRDLDFFEFLEDEISNLLNGNSKYIDQIVKGCCEIKADVVSEDEKESGVRAILNFGHTVGHALEAITNYSKYRHGEAVSIGMIAAARIAMEMDMISDMQVQRLWQVITKAHLPYQIGDIDPADIEEKMKKDKKVILGKVRFVLPTGIGEVIIRNDIPEKLVLEVLEGMK